jgi:ribosomal protein S18 acetylase RimI-like enzyme
MSGLEVRPAGAADRGWIARRMERLWGGTVVVRRGEAVETTALPALVAWRDGVAVGLAVIAVRGDECEVVSIDADAAAEGIGTALLDAAAAAARAEGCARLWLVTTNDNLRALRFYQRRGLRLVALRPGAVEAARGLKPSIPEVGLDGIPLCDELELAMELGE